MSIRIGLLTTVGLGWLLQGCQRQEQPGLAPEIERLQTDLQKSKAALYQTTKALDTKTIEVEVARDTQESIAKQLADKDKALAEKDAQLGRVKAEVDQLKKRDAFVFGEIRALQAQGGWISLAQTRYEAFMRDFPNSPLVPLARSSIAELTAQTQGDARRMASLGDPKRQENEILLRFREGVGSAEELIPLLKNKSAASVVTMIGRPTHTFQDGSEYGYADKVIDGATGKPAMLVVSFAAGKVASLRLGYTGRRIVP